MNFLSSYSLLSLIFEIFDLMLSDWVSFLAYPNLFGIKGFVVVVVEDVSFIRLQFTTSKKENSYMLIQL
jgi:hypothetical protein